MISFVLSAAFAAEPSSGDAPSPLPVFYLHPSGLAPLAVDAEEEDDVDVALLPRPASGTQYRAHVKLADAGFITLCVGAGVSAGSLAFGISNDPGNLNTLLLAIGGITLGLTTAHVGEVLMTVGGLEAAYDLKSMYGRGPVVVGWVGAGMLVGGALLLTTGALADRSTGELTLVGGLLSAGSVVPGAVTYFQVREQGIDLRASVVPTALPVRLASGDVAAIPGLALSATW